MQISEVNRGTCARNTRRVFRDSQDLQSFFGSGMNHFLQTAEGMSAGDGMCMNIQ